MRSAVSALSALCAYAGLLGMPLLILQAAGAALAWPVGALVYVVGLLALGWMSYLLDPGSWRSYRRR